MKAISEMTVAELHAELIHVYGETPSGKKPELQARLEELRQVASREVPDMVDGVVVDDDTAEVPPEIADEVEQAIALREPTVAPMMALPSPQEFNAAQSVALAIANSKVVPEAYRGRPDDVLAAVLYGREIGLGPMTALRDVYMIDGRPAVSAHRQLGLLRRGGVVILESEATMERGWIRAQRGDTGEIMDVEFTWDEAQKIVRKGKALVDGDNWRNYRPDMLWARTVGRLTRRLGPDLIGGLPPYVAEEVADFEGWGVEYGAQGEVRVGPQAVPEHRREFPEFNWPQSWGELTERMGARIGVETTTWWLKQATVAVTGQESLQALAGAKRKVMFRKCSSVLAVLEQTEGDLLFDADLRQTVQAAFAPRVEGVMLEGPPWSIQPSEADSLPSREEWEKAQAGNAATGDPEPSEEASVDTDRESGEFAGSEYQPTAEELAEADRLAADLFDGTGYGG